MRQWDGAPGDEPDSRRFIALVRVPAGVLDVADYVLVLESGAPGGVELQRYSFRVAR